MVSESLKLSRPNLHQWVAFAFFILVTVFAWWKTPHVFWYDHLGRPQFEQVIPMSFGEWEATGDAANTVVNPVQEETLQYIYSQIVSRTYIHKPTGRRVMLSAAYGDDQTYAKQLHRPESCYSSQGFHIDNKHPVQIKVGNNTSVGGFHMTASAGYRQEQVNYWIRIGDKIVSGASSDLNLARMSLGVKGYLADGLLFRISEVSPDAASSDALLQQFSNDLLHSLSPAGQAALIGVPL